MAKKQFFIIVDTETTQENTVADFAAIVVDRVGKIHKQCAIMVNGEFQAKPLFHDEKAGALWNMASLARREAKYLEMLNNGSRMAASKNAINKWLNQAIGQYDPILTAYNLPFDLDKCKNTGIDLDGFSDRFCLWSAANTLICETKAYRQFVAENHLFNNVTDLGNMTYKTNAEAVCGFLKGKFEIEPHTALEDARDFELPILQAIVSKRKWREKINSGYEWRKRQVKDWFSAK